DASDPEGLDPQPPSPRALACRAHPHLKVEEPDMDGMTIVLTVLAIIVGAAFLIHVKARLAMRSPMIPLVDPELNNEGLLVGPPLTPRAQRASKQFIRMYQAWLSGQPRELPMQLLSAQGQVVVPFFQAQTGDDEIAMRMWFIYAHGFYMGKVAKSAMMGNAS
ncbi:hypothetical protein, partial [Arsenicicoccus bolidensis]|uniref:hypothetical protein n=1 Tax=Arsenicicoccus bolidensis TaxID=229480 RepID=UPI001969B421